jgi:pilus assembly protein TadC
MVMAKYLLIIPLLAILVAALWYAVGTSVPAEGPPMPLTGYLAMGLGILFSLVVGCGLMALLFYSNRHGYDDQTGLPDDRD